MTQIVPGSRIAGPARTVLHGQDDNLIAHAVLAEAQPVEVLVLNREAEGTWFACYRYSALVRFGYAMHGAPCMTPARPGRPLHGVDCSVTCGSHSRSNCRMSPYVAVRQR